VKKLFLQASFPFDYNLRKHVFFLKKKKEEERLRSKYCTKLVDQAVNLKFNSICVSVFLATGSFV